MTLTIFTAKGPGSILGQESKILQVTGTANYSNNN